MRAEQQRQLAAVVGAEPGAGGDVGEVAGVEVAVGGAVGGEALERRLGGRAPEVLVAEGVGDGLVGAVGAVGGEEEAFGCVEADDGGLWGEEKGGC